MSRKIVVHIKKKHKYNDLLEDNEEDTEDIPDIYDDGYSDGEYSDEEEDAHEDHSERPRRTSRRKKASPLKKLKRTLILLLVLILILSAAEVSFVMSRLSKVIYEDIGATDEELCINDGLKEQFSECGIINIMLFGIDADEGDGTTRSDTMIIMSIDPQNGCIKLSSILRESKDPRIHPMTSIVAVDVATDLKTCKVYVSVMGNEDDRTETAKGLKSASGFIRRELAHRLNLRNTPELKFIIDTSIEDAIVMMRKIDEITKDLPE